MNIFPWVLAFMKYFWSIYVFVAANGREIRLTQGQPLCLRCHCTIFCRPWRFRKVRLVFDPKSVRLAMGTKRVLEEICFSQSSSDRLAEDAQRLSPESDGEEIPEPPTDQTYRVWWARLLKKHARTSGFRIKNEWLQDPISLISSCSGCCAEAAALKAARALGEPGSNWNFDSWRMGFLFCYYIKICFCSNPAVTQCVLRFQVLGTGCTVISRLAALR